MPTPSSLAALCEQQAGRGPEHGRALTCRSPALPAAPPARHEPPDCAGTHGRRRCLQGGKRDVGLLCAVALLQGGTLSSVPPWWWCIRLGNGRRARGDAAVPSGC